MLNCILQAFKLAIATYLGGVGAFGLMFWLYGIPLVVIAVTSADRRALLLPLFPIGIFVVGLLWYILVRVLYEVLLKALWSNPPQPLRTSQGVASILWNYSITSVGMLPIALIYLAKYGFPVSEEFSQRRAEYMTNLAMQYFWLWLAIAIGCYWARRPAIKSAIQSQRT